MACTRTNGRPESKAGTRTRLTIVVDSQEYGGAEAYVAQLLSHLPDRYERTLLATEPIPQQLREAARSAGAPVVPFVPPRGKFDLARLFGGARVLRSTRPDLVHLNLTTAANNRHLLAAAVALRVPALATLHIVAPLLSTIQRRVLRRAYRRLRRLIAVSDETRRQLCAELGVEDEAVAVVPNGVPSRTPKEHASRRRVRIGGLGRLTRQKGFDLLVEAVRVLVAEGIELEAAVAGEGPEREPLVARAHGLPIEFPGFVSDVSSFLDELDVFCLPSRWEGLPFALLEAMMAGLPCVAADVGDVASALGPTGVVVPPDDVPELAAALRGLATSPALRRDLGSAAHARALARHTTEQMVAATARVYEEALAG